MNRSAIVLGFSLLVLAGSWANEEVEPIEASPWESAILALASDSFQEREAASKTLWEHGEEALSALEAATQSPDPEVSYRARVLWDRIRTGIGPDTPLNIVELVQKYTQSGPHEKSRVLESLSGARAYAQILRLYHFEKDEGARKKCLEIVTESVVPAVRVALANENEEEAIALLRIAPPSDDNFRRLAALYRDTGKIDEILADLRERTDLSEAPLLLACLRAKGDVDEAIVVAKELDRHDVAGGLELLKGNPVSYIQWKIDDGETSSLERLHMEILLENWSGNTKQADRLARPMIEMAKDSDEESSRALRSMLLNGYFEEAEVIMKKDHAMLLFSYYETMEEPWKAMELLGYTRDKKEQAKWRDEHVELLQKTWNFYSMENVSYFIVPGMLYQKGATEEALSLVRPMMHAAREAGDEHWDEFIDFLGERGRVYTEMGFVLLAEEIRPETEEKEVADFLSGLTRRNEGLNSIWKALGVKEGTSLKDRFLSYGKVYGYVPCSEEELNELWTYLEECEEPVVEDRELVKVVVNFRSDNKRIVELFERVDAADVADQFNLPVARATYYSFHHRWEDSEKEWAALMPENGVGNRYLGFYAGVLWRLGKIEEAQTILEELTAKNLDDPLLLKNIAVSLESNGVWELAATYWRQILLTSDPSSRHWVHAVEKYTRDAKVRKDWNLASSFALLQNAVAISGETFEDSPVLNLRKYFYLNFFKALDEMENGERERAEKRLHDGFSVLVGDGILADDFFPILREEGYTKLHDAFFEQAYARFSQSIEDFPESHNTRNGAAWLASRSARRLDEAEAHVTKALEMRPRQAAYLDTMAEVWFARHDREKAIEWSTRSLTDSQFAGHNSEGGAELRAQHDRFLTGEFPAR